MKTKGRPSSKNMEDRRAYFGTISVDRDYPDEDRRMDFLKNSLANPSPDAPQKFKKLTLEDLITEAINNGR